jgi:hypothetical protein
VIPTRLVHMCSFLPALNGASRFTMEASNRYVANYTGFLLQERHVLVQQSSKYRIVAGDFIVGME